MVNTKTLNAIQDLLIVVDEMYHLESLNNTQTRKKLAALMVELINIRDEIQKTAVSDLRGYVANGNC